MAPLINKIADAKSDDQRSTLTTTATVATAAVHAVGGIGSYENSSNVGDFTR